MGRERQRQERGERERQRIGKEHFRLKNKRASFTLCMKQKEGGARKETQERKDKWGFILLNVLQQDTSRNKRIVIFIHKKNMLSIQ